jgi:hypothetical protein
MTTRRAPGRAAARLGALLVLCGLPLLSGGLDAGAADQDAGPSRPPITIPARRPSATITPTPAQLSLPSSPCFAAPVELGIGNDHPEPIYADVRIEADPPLELSRRAVSSYLPPGYVLPVSVDVSAPDGTPPGEYALRARSGRRSTVVPVTITDAADHPNLAVAATVSASSTNSAYPPCGAADGNRDSADWGSTTGWNDDTNGVYPDWLELRFDAPREVATVEVVTLDSAQYPAAEWGLRDWDVQVLRDGAWVTVAEVRGNTAGAVRSTLSPPVTTEAVRVLTFAGNRIGDYDYSRIVEVEIYGPGGAP